MSGKKVCIYVVVIKLLTLVSSVLLPFSFASVAHSLIRLFLLSLIYSFFISLIHFSIVYYSFRELISHFISFIRSFTLYFILSYFLPCLAICITTVCESMCARAHTCSLVCKYSFTAVLHITEGVWHGRSLPSQCHRVAFDLPNPTERG